MSTSMNPLHRRGINKLPLELLTEIFKLASTHRFLDEGRTVPPAYTLIALSHVCGMWRAAIRGAPQLWTIVCGVEPPALVREIVALSQKMPLAILCAAESHYELGDKDRADEIHDAGEDGEDESDDASDVWEDTNDGRDHGGSGATSRDAAETLLEHLHRTSEIQISLDHNDMPDLLPLFDVDAPLLESLALRVVGGDAPVVVNPFKGTAPPRLTSLSLHGGCELSQTSALWANLTHLHLHRSYCHREPHPTNSTFAHLSSALTQMSSLTDLGLHSAIPPDIWAFTMSTIPAIALPRLVALTLRDFTSKCILFLNALCCELGKLDVAAAREPFGNAYDDYANNHLYLFGECRDLVDAALTRNPLAGMTLRRTRQGFLMKGTRARADGPTGSAGHECDDPVNPVKIELVGGLPRASAEIDGLVASSLATVPPRETGVLRVDLEGINAIDGGFVAWSIEGLECIRVETVRINGYEDEWWLPSRGDSSLGDHNGERGADDSDVEDE
ncbi:hypothetical protein EYR40_006091 [Pleurotus pulmonarius]|nr:hypothetical protein EYR36_010711 [Pleurotus pulmonarius]KAF4599003.1 hypothetical protein EYR40_006091 [Pleurotus pulmonarius]